MKRDPLREMKARRHIELTTEWLRVALSAHARRLQRAEVLPATTDPWRGQSVTTNEVKARLTRPMADATVDRGLPAEDLATLADADAQFALALKGLRAGGDGLPLDIMSSALQFTPHDLLLLQLAIAGDFSPDFPRFYAFLNDRVDRQYATTTLAMELLVAPQEWVALRARLDPHAPLFRHDILVLGGDVAAPPTQRPLLLTARARRFLSGEITLADELIGWADRYGITPTDAGPVYDEEQHKRLTQVRYLVSQASDQWHALPLLMLRGPEGAGRRRFALAVANGCDRALVVFDLVDMGLCGVPIDGGLRKVVTEARLLNAFVCLAGWDAWSAGHVATGEEDDGFVALAGQSLQRKGALLIEQLAREVDGPIFMLTSDPTVHGPELARGTLVIEMGMPAVEASTELWARALPKTTPNHADVAADLGAELRLTPGKIEAAARVAARTALLENVPVSTAMVRGVVTTQLRHRLREIATLVTARYAWDELVVPPTVKVQLREMVSRHQNRRQVMDTWQYGKRFGNNYGMSVLFEGPPGTGKTMAASIIAAELGLELFQVDLTKVVSKYIGETEKALGRLFDEAEHAGGIILFDEADSIFSKRTAVKSSNDRYSNMKVNYLLQRIEAFSGIAILTTNFPENLDPAFARRTALRVKFRAPDSVARRQIWATMLGQHEGLHEDIDLDEIAEQFEMSGGHIKNSVLRAAYIAAAASGVIEQDYLRLAARLELMQLGKLLTGDPLKDLEWIFEDQEGMDSESEDQSGEYSDMF